MALKLSYQTAAGLTLPAAYARIGKFVVENPCQGGRNVSFDVSIYADQAARDAGKPPVWGPQGYTFLLGGAPDYFLDKAPGEMVIADAYAYLKTRAEFQGAADV